MTFQNLQSYTHHQRIWLPTKICLLTSRPLNRHSQCFASHCTKPFTFFCKITFSPINFAPFLTKSVAFSISRTNSSVFHLLLHNPDQHHLSEFQPHKESLPEQLHLQNKQNTLATVFSKTLSISFLLLHSYKTLLPTKSTHLLSRFS